MERVKFKLVAPSLGTGMAVPGVQLSFQHVQSELLPKKSGLYFFMIEHSSNDPVWEKIVKENEMLAVGAEGFLKKVKLSLYTTISGD